jgi:hypothetical protein
LKTFGGAPDSRSVWYSPKMGGFQHRRENEDGEPFGLSTNSELAKPLSEQAMQLEYLPVRALDQDLYKAGRAIRPTMPS